MGMTAKLKIHRKGLRGPIWGLFTQDEENLLGQYPTDSEEKALDFFLTDKDNLKAQGYVAIENTSGKIISLN